MKTNSQETLLLIFLGGLRNQHHRYNNYDDESKARKVLDGGKWNSYFFVTLDKYDYELNCSKEKCAITITEK